MLNLVATLVLLVLLRRASLIVALIGRRAFLATFIVVTSRGSRRAILGLVISTWRWEFTEYYRSLIDHRSILFYGFKRSHLGGRECQRQTLLGLNRANV